MVLPDASINSLQRSTLPLTVASYNVHKCVGTDGRQDLERIAMVLHELKARIIGLQEVDSGIKNGSQTDYLAAATGFTAIPGPAILRPDGYYGNVLLTDCPVVESNCVDLTVSGWEPRSAIDAVLGVHNQRVRVIVTHLGLTGRERKHQVDRLLDLLCGEADELLIVLGDVNEWFPLSPRLRSLQKCLGKNPGLRTFPSRFPVLALDRIWVKPRDALAGIRVHTSPIARVASDHLPVRADILLENTKQEAAS